MNDPGEKASMILRRLQPLYAELTTGLHFDNPLQLLVATILSAQCTDERVNMVTPGLFARYRTAEAFAHADGPEMERLIHACGFFRNKAKNIRAMATRLVEVFDGRVPDTMAELVTLPGVARKTANVVLCHGFDRNEGIAVDTHVHRLAHRLELSAESDPNRVEADLMRLFPEDEWGRVSDTLIWHGRKVCKARKPRCGKCVVAVLCPSAAIQSDVGESN